MLENWKPVIGYEGRYEVSDLGRVRSLTVRAYRRISYGRVLRQSLNDCGYPYVNLSDGRKQSRRKVHRLVALAFLGPCPDGKEVAHNDGRRTNNAVDNLRYATTKENVADMRNHGTTLFGERSPNAKLTNAQVKRIRLLAGSKRQIDLAEQFGVGQNTISRIINRLRWPHI